MDIRGERIWCQTCTAPEVRRENVPVIDFFLQALPAWRGGQGMMGSVAVEGFDRSEILAMMDLRCVPTEERAETWAAIADMESEYRRIRAAKSAK